MFFTMTTKPILNCFILLIICSSSESAQVGDSCVVKSTGFPGICKITADCLTVQEQAQNGISPTICGFYQLTVPIVCCEQTTFPEPNNLNLDSDIDSSIIYPDNNDPQPPRRPARPSRPSRPTENNYNNQNNYNQNNYNNQNNHNSNQNNHNSNQNNHNSNQNSYNNNNQNNHHSNQNNYNNNHNNQYASKSEQKCQEYSKSVTGVVQAIPLVTNTEAISVNVVKCDYNGVALIVGGKPAAAGEFPFMAAIGFYSDNKIEWRCGGTLISEEYVLTAAHCTFTRDGDSPKIVRLGDLDLSRDDDGSIHTDYNIRNIIVHPNYRYPQKYNDIALIQMSTIVRFTKFIRPACLNTKAQVEQAQAIATGWGKTDYAAAEISDKLMKVSLNVYSNDRCAQTYQVNKHLPQGIKSTMICAGELSGGMDTCQGDSGGPLLVTKKGNQCKFYVIGITSFGKSCGQANTPAIYTKVSEFVPWIEKIIW